MEDIREIGILQLVQPVNVFQPRSILLYVIGAEMVKNKAIPESVGLIREAAFAFAAFLVGHASSSRVQ